MYKQSKPLKQPENSEHGFNYAMFLLNLSAKTETELRKKLTQRGYAAGVIDEVIKRLKEYDYINDVKYAESFIATMKSYKTYGYFAIRQKMALKLLQSTLVEKSLRVHFTLEDEREVMERYLEQQLPKTDNKIKSSAKKRFDKLPYEDKQKLMRKLASRGFRMDIILN